MTTTARWIPDDASAYKVGEHGWEYAFPFTLMDTTPGGANLGRIEWHVEIQPTKRKRGEKFNRVGTLRVWATQTRDPRYQHRIFEFDTFAESLGFARDADFHEHTFQPWHVGFCNEHRGAVILTAYPNNEHSVLTVAPTSSIQIEVGFK